MAMNIMRKFWVGGGGGGGGGGSAGVGGVGGENQDASTSQHAALGLMHLKKLFSEYTHPPQPLDEKERETKLYNMLPLFCKVFGNSPSSDMMDKFADILSLCQQVSKLMVSEIRRRASNQSTEAASCAIAKFLEIESSEEASNGWMLLSTLNLLSMGDPSLVEVMTAASVPSTLVKCLYLFFDLPPLEEDQGGNGGDKGQSEFSAQERRVLLQKVFVQVLVRLCSHVPPAEELARKDDLTLLFSAITSWCPQSNAMWRKSAAELLMTLSRHGLSPPVVSYIHNKGCVALCIENMQRSQDLSPLEIVEMVVTVFCFLKDSSEVSQTLLDDFRSCQGYVFLSEFLLRLEQDVGAEAQEATRNLVLLVASLSMCGYIELKPSQASLSSLFQMPGFVIPAPSGRGSSVRNLQAFQVLQSVFLKSTTTLLSGTILDAISSIYHSDSANYFILEGQNTLSQFAEKIHLKPMEIQEKLFGLLEFVVFQLNFVPCKELISLSILLKGQQSVECSICCMNTLLNILRHNIVFKDVYREVGILEVFVTCLHHYASLLKEKQQAKDEGKGVVQLDKQEEQLGFLVCDALTHLLGSNPSNASVFRESGGARCVHNLVPHLECRQQALGIVRQLILSSGGEDDMATLLGMMHSSPAQDLELKTHILKSLLKCLRESHRTRTVFRKVGGFVYVMSVLVSMEGSLSSAPKPPWDTVGRRDILSLLHLVFNTLTIAMRFEPANAKFFHQEICYTSLCDTIRLLGCFSTARSIDQIDCQSYVPGDEETFHSLFTGSVTEPLILPHVPPTLAFACLMLRLLYDMTLDEYDKPSCPALTLKSPPTHRQSSNSETPPPTPKESSPSTKRQHVSSLNLNPPTPDPIIVHPGVVVAILHLLPSINLQKAPQMALTLQVYTAEVLKSLVRSEHNQQVMCDAGFPSELLSRFGAALEDESHVLHPPLQYMLERLAAQTLEPKDLRRFLRLGHPLRCISPESGKQPAPELRWTDSELQLPADLKWAEPLKSKCAELRRAESTKGAGPGGPVPLTRVKTLVSMTTPRDFRLHGTAILPPFVEFNMATEGFGCLYLPSIAPQSPSGPSVVGVGVLGTGDSCVVGGIGSGDRIFPPQPGLTFSTWICVDRFSCPRNDAHPIRLLTLVRHVQGREEQLVCLCIVMSTRDKSLVVSTQEVTSPPPNMCDWEPEPSGDAGARVWCPDLLQEGQWHHLVFVLNRAVLKNSSFSLYLDGQHIHNQKMHYISQNPGGGAANLTVAASVYGYIGTPPNWRRHSRLSWKQGPCHLIEEVVTHQTVQVLYRLGPHYMGSLQAPEMDGGEPLSPLVSEDKVILGLNAMAVSGLTLAKIRKIYSKADCKSIAKQLGMSTHENATPIRVLHNSAGHLSGPARSLGGVVIGYLGVRVFCPRPVAKSVEDVGGCAVLLGLVAMARDVESLYAAVKALVCVVRSNSSAQMEMDRQRGYQTMAMLLKKKRHLLNSHVLHLTFSLVGTVDSGRESTGIPNVTAFKDLLADLEVWHEAPGDLQRSLYEHFFELVSESSERKANLAVLRELNMVTKLLHVLRDTSISTATSRVLLNLLGALLANQPRVQDLLSFGQFVASTLPTSCTNEKGLNLDPSEPERVETHRCECGGDDNQEEPADQPVGNGAAEVGEEEGGRIGSVLLRNKCLSLLHKLASSNGKAVNLVFCEEVSRVLGMDWVLLVLQGHLHPTTVVWALRILLLLTSTQQLMAKFREGSSNGGWLSETASVTHNRVNIVLGYQIDTGGSKPISREVKEEALHVPGFQQLNWLMPKHIHVPEVYFLLIALLLGQPVKHLPNNLKLDLDSVWQFVFGASTSQAPSSLSGRVVLCPEAVITILEMVRAMLNHEAKSLPDWLQSYPVTLIQFLYFLYHNTADFMPMFMSAEVLTALAGTLFPRHSSSNSDSESSTPLEEIKAYPGCESVVMVQSPSKEKALTNHPARKFVMDFLRMIVVDSLSLPVSGKGPPVIDLILDISPEHTSHAQQCRFQTEILSAVMEHLLAADILIGEQAALPIVPGGSRHQIAPNVFYLAGRLVDKMWQGTFTKDPHDVFDFIVLLISQARRRSLGTSLGSSLVGGTLSGTLTSSLGGTLALDAIHHSLNRTILFLLSRQTNATADQVAVLEALHKLTNNRGLIFGGGNHELEFFGCLVYCLLQLTADFKIITDSSSKTTWHVNPGPVTDTQDVSNKRRDCPEAEQGQNLMAGAARRVWEELYVCKKPAIEEVFKVALNCPNNRTPDLQALRDQLHEPACKLWLTYIDIEKKASYRMPWEIQSQIQSKIQKMTGGLTRLASRTKARREDTIKVRQCNLPMSEVQLWTFNHVGIVKELVDYQLKQYQQSHQHMQKYVFYEWLQTEAELTRERGLWGPEKGSKLDKWMLDMTEGPCRMRKKMIYNDIFYHHYPYRPEVETVENRALKYKVATSCDSKEYYHQNHPQTMFEREKEVVVGAAADSITHNSTSEDEPDNGEEAREIGFQGLHNTFLRPRTNRSISELEEEPETESLDPGDPSETGENSPDNQTLLRLLEEGEKINHMFRCARIQGLDTTEGLLLFGKEHFYVIDGFTISKSREIRDIDYLPPGTHDPILPCCTQTTTSSGASTSTSTKRQCSKFAYEDIREVHQRRYLLQPIALEVFSADGRNYLLAFLRKVRNKVYQRFNAVATAIQDSAQHSVAGQKRTANVEQAAGIFSSLIGDTSVTQRWVRGEISNFQYLMHLNTLAGRSYNDLMQYPVFPWILSNYDSEELDLTDPSNFRDFSRPMGAQSPDRLEQFRKRFREWDDPHGETPPYHYGTHYSSAMIVCSYLVRMEPFTQHFLRLQGGHFDLADRMFHSVREAWLSASRHNMADVKELIPEFFYLPEFLANENNFDLGCKQNGVALGDVLLPQWAKGDTLEFIRMHRAALECDYVSQHLHEWIDLVFGCKQHGPQAVEAVNVFHHLFYEGNVDIYNIDDPLKKNATIGFINNFGQIPKQLFRKPHPAKRTGNNQSSSRLMDASAGGLQASFNLASSSSSSASSALFAPPTVSPSDRLFFHNLDNLRPSMQPIKELKGPVGQILQADKQVLAVEQNKCLVPPSFGRCVGWGFADHSLRVGAYESEKAGFVSESVQSGEVVACVCPSAKVLVAGCTSSVVLVWELGRRHLVLKQSLYAHTDAVTCLAASPAYNLIVSGSRDSTAVIWDLSRLSFVRLLSGHAAPVAAVAVNEATGDIATCAGTWLHLWTCNGVEIACVNTAVGRADRMQQILCVAFSQMNEWDPQNVVMTGSTDGVVRMWSVDYVQVPIEDMRADSKDDGLKKTGKEEERAKSEEKEEDTAPTIQPPALCLDAEEDKKEGDDDDDEEMEAVRERVRRMSMSATEYSSADAKGLAKSASESSLSEDEVQEIEDEEVSRKERRSLGSEKDTDTSLNPDESDSAAKKGPAKTATKLLQRQGALSSVGSAGSLSSIESDAESAKGSPEVVMRAKRLDKPRQAFRKSEGSQLAAQLKDDGSSTGDGLAPPTDTSMRASKSDTSLADSFVMIGDREAEEAKEATNPAGETSAGATQPLGGGTKRRNRRSQNCLREGFRWQRQLVFRSKLTMHTAYDRKDNAEPASVTALSTSRDHRTVYVGDARGRVFSWSVCEQPGRMTDHWLKDEGAETCTACGVRFSLYERRHHCRNCGMLFCSRCSRFESEISRLRILKPVRVCQTCFTQLRAQDNGNKSAESANTTS